MSLEYFREFGAKVLLLDHFHSTDNASVECDKFDVFPELNDLPLGSPSDE
jgi:hypothetical protein